VSELFEIYGRTSSVTTNAQLTTETSGVLVLNSTLWSGNATFIRIPKGCAMKIWESKVFAHNPATVHIQHMDTSSTTLPYQSIETDSVHHSGEEVRTSRSGRPIVVESHDGEQFVRFLFDGSIFGNDMTSGMILASYNTEIVELTE